MVKRPLVLWTVVHPLYISIAVIKRYQTVIDVSFSVVRRREKIEESAVIGLIFHGLGLEWHKWECVYDMEVGSFGDFLSREI